VERLATITGHARVAYRQRTDFNSIERHHQNAILTESTHAYAVITVCENHHTNLKSQSISFDDHIDEVTHRQRPNR
jgi:hypothetical protein